MNQDAAAKSPADGKYVFLSYARADEKTAKGGHQAHRAGRTRPSGGTG